MIFFVVPINPEPWAIGDLSVGRRNGGLFPFIGPNHQLVNYQNAVREELEAQEPLRIDGPVKLEFYFWRQLDEGSRGGKRKRKAHYADTTNLQKATEDAIQGLLIGNDREVVSIRSVLVSQGPEITGRVVIGLEAETVPPRREPPDEVVTAITARARVEPAEETVDRNVWPPPS